MMAMYIGGERRSQRAALTRLLEERFAHEIGVDHAICVANGTVALMLLAKALDLCGEVIMPGYTFPAGAQALSWAGLKPVFADVDRRTHMICVDTVAPVISGRTVAVFGTHVWGRACDPDGLSKLCKEKGLDLIFDACHAVACTYGGQYIGKFGRGEAFSFHATKVLSSGEGGCITTKDAKFAAAVRGLRDRWGKSAFAPHGAALEVSLSEAQAVLGLLSLDQLGENVTANRRRYDEYVAGLSGIPGVSVVHYDQIEQNNYQYVVLEIEEESFGLSRDRLEEALRAERILCRKHFYDGLHHMPPFVVPDLQLKNTEHLCKTVIQVPNGQVLTIADVRKICTCVRRIQQSGSELTAQADSR